MKDARISLTRSKNQKDKKTHEINYIDNCIVLC